MRARNLKPALFRNEVLGIADPLLTILFEGLWCEADREGRLEDRPLRLHASILPYRPGFDIEAGLNWLKDNDFIDRYESGGVKVILVTEFLKHQRPHKNEAPSSLPGKNESKSRQGRKPAQPKHDQGTKSDGPKQERLGLLTSSLTPSSLTPDPLNKTSPPLPAEVCGEAFETWIAYRSAARKPVKQASYQALHRKFMKLGDHDAQRAAVEHSVANGYIGIFAERANGAAGAPRKTRYELAMEGIDAK